MGQNVGQVEMDLVLQSKSFGSQLRTAVDSSVKKSTAVIDNGSKSISKSMGSMVGKFTKIAAITVAAKELISFGVSATKAGSDLSEVENIVDTVFPNMQKQVDDFAKSSMTSFGLNETVTKNYIGTLGSMAKQFGFTEAQAYDMGKSLTGLIGDVASFYNISTDVAYTKLKSVFTGETESLKELGVVMTQSALDGYALANGFGKTTSSMTENEKVALRYGFVLQQLSAVSGDFNRTSDGWANSTKTLSQNFQTLKAAIGQGLIAALLPVLKLINGLILGLTTLANKFTSFMGSIFGKKTNKSPMASIVTDSAIATSNLGSMGTQAIKTAKSLTKSVMGFDKLNKLSESADSAGSSGSSAPSIGTSLIGGPVATIGIDTDEAGMKTKLGSFGKTMKNIIKGWVNWFGKNKEGIKHFFSELAEAGGFLWSIIGPILEFLSKLVQKFFSFILDNSELVITAIMMIAGAFLTFKALSGIITAVATAQALLNAAMALSPITWIIVGIGALVAGFAYLWNTSDSFKQFWINLWEGIKSTIAGVIEFIKNVFTTDWTKSFGVIGVIFNNFFDILEGKINAIKRIIGGIIDFITGIFTGDWTKAWNGIKDIFGGIFDSMAVIIKAPINAIISAINLLISGLNSIDIKIPDWVPGFGGDEIGFNIPKIPKLAQGGFVEANTPQLAMIGDNRHQGEVVAPESKLQEMANAAVEGVLAKLLPLLGMQQATSGDITIPIYVNNELTDEYIVNAGKREAFRSGGR